MKKLIAIIVALTIILTSCASTQNASGDRPTNENESPSATVGENTPSSADNGVTAPVLYGEPVWTAEFEPLPTITNARTIWFENEQIFWSSENGVIRDSNGAEIVKISEAVTAKINEIGNSNYYNYYCLNSEGTLYYFDRDTQKLNALSIDGSKLFTANADTGSQPFLLTDGNIGVQGLARDNSFTVLSYDKAGGKAGDTAVLPFSDRPARRWSAGFGDYLFFYSANGSLKGFNSATKETEVIFNWLDTNIDESQLVTISGGADIYRVILKNNANEFELATIEMKPQRLDKITLELAGFDIQDDLKNAVLDFNRANSDYMIHVTDYIGNAGDDRTAALTKFSVDIITGNVPDLIDTTYLDTDTLASSGLFADLYEFIDNDPAYNRETLLSAPLRALETSGKLYTIPNGFQIRSLAGLEKIVGTKKLSFDLIETLTKKYPGAKFYYYANRDVLLEIFMGNGFRSFVNWEMGTCDFNSKGFVDILEFCADFAPYGDSFSAYKAEELIMSDVSGLFSQVYLNSFSNIQELESSWGGKINFSGYPATGGNGSVYDFWGGVAISSVSEHKAAAWDFVRTTFDSTDGYGFPIVKILFDEKFKEEQRSISFNDEITYNLTSDDYNRFLELINGITERIHSNQTIQQIIKEESAPYFAGQKTAEQAAAIIQSRASLYVAEHL